MYRKLTAAEAKEAMKRKGWTNRALATWWGISEEHCSRIVNDPDRSQHYDDALRGMPVCPDATKNSRKKN